MSRQVKRSPCTLSSKTQCHQLTCHFEQFKTVFYLQLHTNYHCLAQFILKLQDAYHSLH